MVFTCFYLHHMSIRLEDYLSGSFPTCIQQSATDGYLRNEDCRELHPFVCEVKKNVAFTQPSEGMPIHFTFLLVFGIVCYSETYIISPNYPNGYPNNYEEVFIYINVMIYFY